MTKRTAVPRLFLVSILGAWALSQSGRAQDREAEPAPSGKAVETRSGRVVPVETDPDFQLWRRKAQLELEILQAQVEAKKAEILFREAEHRAKKHAPDLAILTKLEEPITMAFAQETPLEVVLKYVKSATGSPKYKGIPIYVDPEGLHQAEKTLMSTVRLDIEGAPLKTTLRLALKQLGLTYGVKDGLLVITAEGSAP